MSAGQPVGQPTAGPRRAGRRPVGAPRGTALTCKGWPQEAAIRMLINTLDPQVAEPPDQLIVYGGSGRAARSWDAFDAIVGSLRDLESDETLLVQSGKPVGVFRTHEWAPRVLIANSNLVPQWSTWEEFRRLEQLGLTMYAQMTARSWISIGSQGIAQGTYECFPPIPPPRLRALPSTPPPLRSPPGWAGGAAPSPSGSPGTAGSPSVSRWTRSAFGGASRPATWTRSRMTSPTPSPAAGRRRPSGAR